MSSPLLPRALAETDDRSGFDCGREALNNWFRRHALPNHLSGASRVTVLTEQKSNRIIGYVTLSAAQIERAYLPKSQQRNRPDPIPVTLLGQLAVDQAFKGQGHGASLLHYALKTSRAAADAIGSVGVVTHPIDDAVRSYHAHWGFVELPFDPRRAMIIRMVDLKGF